MVRSTVALAPKASYAVAAYKAPAPQVIQLGLASGVSFWLQSSPRSEELDKNA